MKEGGGGCGGQGGRGRRGGSSRVAAEGAGTNEERSNKNKSLGPVERIVVVIFWDGLLFFSTVLTTVVEEEGEVFERDP